MGEKILLQESSALQNSCLFYMWKVLNCSIAALFICVYFTFRRLYNIKYRLKVKKDEIINIEETEYLNSSRIRKMKMKRDCYNEIQKK